MQSGADNLSAIDDDNYSNVFVHDRETGRTRLVSRNSGGEAADDSSDMPEPNAGSISADGAFIGFESAADNLSGVDDNGCRNRVRSGAAQLAGTRGADRPRASPGLVVASVPTCAAILLRPTIVVVAGGCRHGSERRSEGKEKREESPSHGHAPTPRISV
jgi:hypothetical protein